MSKVVRHSMKYGELHGDNVFYCARPGIFGNPFTHIKDEDTKAVFVTNTRDEAIDLYSDYFDKMVERDVNFKKAFDEMYDAYLVYPEIVLVCFCDMDERCHCDVIEKKLAQRLMKEKLEKLKKR